jgi:hypothetical protein
MKQAPVMHPLAIAAIATLVVNDHVLKHAFPGFVTGKLSDAAGMVFFPLLLTAFTRSRRALAIACVATAVVFALVKTLPAANGLYRVTWGAMQWPLRALRAWLAHRPAPGIARVVLVRDPSDLLAVPFVLLAWRIGVTHRQTFGRGSSHAS